MTSQEKYALLDKLNLCHRCEKARPAPGRKFCSNCLEKNAEYCARHYDPQKAKAYQARRREIYREKKERGICVRCSKPATHGLFCYEHAINAKRRNAATAERRKWERHERGLIPEIRSAKGLCLRCGKQASEGAYCDECMEKIRDGLNRAREKSPWREMERVRIENIKRQNNE